MSPEIVQILTGIFIVILCLAAIGGMIKTFKRNWILAIIMMILVFPVWICWALVEMFTGEIKPKVVYVQVENKGE